MDVSGVSMYVNPNTGQVTSNLKNAYIDKQKYGRASNPLMNNFEINNDMPTKFASLTRIDKRSNYADFAKGTVLTLAGGYRLTLREDGQWIVSGGDGNEKRWQDAMEISSALGILIDVASGRRMMVSYEQEGWERFEKSAKKTFDYLGLDYTKDFTINGMKFTWDEEHSRVFSKTYLDAKEAYDVQKANNRIYEFADERTKREIEHKASYFLQTAPEMVRNIFWQTIEETGANPFAMGNGNTISQLAMEQDFATGGNDQLFGDSVESAIEAVKKILERIDNPLGTITEEKQADLQEEKEFYTSLLNKLENL